MLRIIASVTTWFFVVAAFCSPANASSVLVSSTITAAANVLAFPQYGRLFANKNHSLPNHPDIERFCLALAIYHEARGEPISGQYAVGMTILNRVRSNAYPNTVCGVVYQNAEKLNRCQFSFACDNRSEFPKNQDALKRAQQITDLAQNYRPYSENGPVDSSSHSMLSVMTHYHRFDVRPVWSRKLDRLAGIGNHVFFKSDRVVKKYRVTTGTEPKVSRYTSTEESMCKIYPQFGLEV